MQSIDECMLTCILLSRVYKGPCYKKVRVTAAPDMMHYTVKQEIFLSDATTCFNLLKRMMNDLRTEQQLQMAQATVKYFFSFCFLLSYSYPTKRPAAVTLAPDPEASFVLDFDNLISVSIRDPIVMMAAFFIFFSFQNWDEYLTNAGTPLQYQFFTIEN